MFGIFYMNISFGEKTPSKADKSKYDLWPMSGLTHKSITHMSKEQFDKAKEDIEQYIIKRLDQK